MASFSAGTTFTDGVANDVTAAKLAALVNNATPTSGLIQDRTAETITATNDTLLIGDASDSNNLKRITVANFAQTLPTAKVTTGTIDTATLGTTTGTEATFTTGTVTTLTAGTTTSTAATITSGTIPTLTAGTTTGTAASFSGDLTIADKIVHSGDTNTAIRFPADDTVTVETNGTEQLRVDSSGNVGIGTTSPTIISSNSKILDIVGDASGAVRFERTNSTNPTYGYVGATNGAIELRAQSNTPLLLSTNNTERLRIDSSGKALIGTTSNDTGGRLEVKQASGETGIGIQSSGTDDSKLYFRTASGTYGGDILFNGSYLKFSSGTTERLRITSGGFMKASDSGTYVNSTSSIHELRNSTSNEVLLASNSNAVPYGIQIRFSSAPNDATSQFLNCNDGNGTTNRAIIRSNGGILNYQANNVNLSDERLKTDIQPSPSYLDKICSIPVVNFKYKDQTHDDYNLGVIAQQVEAVCPEFVDADGVGETPEDGIPIKAIYQTDLQFAIMKCIQELKAENDNLKARIEALEAA